MLLFIEFNLLIVGIIIVRFLSKGKVSHKLRYSLWILLPLFLLLFSLISIPVKVQVPERFQRFTSDNQQKYEEPKAPMSYEELPEDKPILYPLNKETLKAHASKQNSESQKAVSSELTQSHIEKFTKQNPMSIDIIGLARIVYLIGVGIVLSIVAINNALFARRVLRNRKYYSTSSYGKLKVYRLEKLKSPFLFIHSIYIGDDLDEETSLYKYAILHEYCHYKQKDNIWICLKYVILILFWFDPLVWVSYRLSQRDSELSADEAVIRITGKANTKSYARSLLNLVTQEYRDKGMLTASTAMSGKNSSFTKERVVSIVNGTRRSIAATLCVAVFMTSIVGCSVFKVKNKYTLSEKRYVPDDAPWYTSSEITFDTTKYGSGFVNHKVLISTEEYFVSLGVGFWQNESCDPRCYVTKMDFDGNVIEECDITECLDLNENNVPFGYSINGTDSIIISSRDPATNLLQYRVYDVDYSSSTLVNEQLIPVNDAFADQTNILSVRRCGQYLVYLLENCFNGEYAFLSYDLNHQEYEITQIRPGRDIVLNFESETNLNLNRTAKSQLYYVARASSEQTIYSFQPSSQEFVKVRSSADLNLKVYWLEDGSYVRIEDGKLIRIDARTGAVLETIIDFSYSNLGKDTYSQPISAYSEGRIVFRIDDDNVIFGNHNEKYIVVKKADVNPHAGKALFTVACFQDSTVCGIDRFVEEYNGQDNPCFLEVTDRYSYYALVSDGMSIVESRAYANDLLASDIRSGQGPDIVIGSPMFSSAAPDQLFTDLSKYMAESLEPDRGSYVPIVFNYTDDRKAYSIPFRLVIRGISVEEGYVDSIGCTYEEYIDLINHTGSGKDVLDEMLRNSGYAEDPSDTDYFTYLYEISPESFIENGKLNITKGENADKFRALAEFVRDRKQNFETKSDSRNASITTVWINDFYGYLSSSSGKMNTIMGFPSYEQTGPFSMENYTFSITNCCPDKDAAWEICSHLLGYDFQSHLTWTIPVRLDALEADADEVIQGIKNGVAGNYSWDVSHADLENWKKTYIDCVSSISYIASYDPSIVVILNEEMPAYFNGDKSLENVCAVIESRVNNMLEERK
ncbi:MAG: hypothetical protein IK020_11380 [Clostridiales bacterium]|nr:hypothetical protein [Clostridiales bacterium]